MLIKAAGICASIAIIVACIIVPIINGDYYYGKYNQINMVNLITNHSSWD